jgi:fatty acid synthase subunit alpha
MMLSTVLLSVTLLGSPRCFGTVDQEIAARSISLLNCVDPDLLTYMQYNINWRNASKGNTHQLAKQFSNSSREVIGMPPVNKDGKL